MLTVFPKKAADNGMAWLSKQQFLAELTLRSKFIM